MRARITGLELLVIAQRSHFELRYEDGGYRTLTGKPIEGLADRSCFDCLGSYYTLRDQEVEFCPCCGHMERRGFSTAEELLEWSLTQDWGYLDKVPFSAFACHSDGGWRLVFARSESDLRRADPHAQLRSVYPRM